MRRRGLLAMMVVGWLTFSGAGALAITLSGTLVDKDGYALEDGTYVARVEVGDGDSGDALVSLDVLITQRDGQYSLDLPGLSLRSDHYTANVVLAARGRPIGTLVDSQGRALPDGSYPGRVVVFDIESREDVISLDLVVTQRSGLCTLDLSGVKVLPRSCVTEVRVVGGAFREKEKTSKTWRTKGNVRVNPDKHFLGTRDATELTFRTKDRERMRIGVRGYVGIGRADPRAMLHVAEDFQADGQVQSGAPTGTPPFAVDSETRVDRLNSDLVDGHHASAFAEASHAHDDRYYTEAELGGPGLAGVHWRNLTNAPPGFADGLDDDTIYHAGAGLALDGATFGARFGGSGSADTVARGDHDHSSQTWRSSEPTALCVVSTSDQAKALHGCAGSSAGTGVGVEGESAAAAGTGVRGYTTAAGEGNRACGVMGEAEGANGTAVMGFARATESEASDLYPVGLHGKTASPNGVVCLLDSAGGQILVARAQGRNVLRVDSSGRLFAEGGFQASGADFAESMSVVGKAADYEPGDVLVISRDGPGNVERCTEAYCTRVIGVYATKPSLLGTTKGIDADLSQEIPVGIIGIVPCKVDATYGPINPGDLLTTSPTAGHAMRHDPTQSGPRPGGLLGKALGRLPQGRGLIDVAIILR